MLGIHCSHIRASCPCLCSSSLSGGKFCCCMHKLRMEHHRMEQGHHNCRLVLHSCLQEHRIPVREQHSLRKEHHSLKRELHMILQGHSFEVENSSGVRNTHHCNYSCTSCPCPCFSSFPSCGRFCHKHSHRRILGLHKRGRQGHHSCLLVHSFGEPHMKGHCSSLEPRTSHNHNPCPCLCSSSLSGGRFSCMHSCQCLFPSPH